MKVLFILCVLFLSSSLLAKNIGTIGQIYPIKEVNFLEFIQSRALFMQQNGMLKKLQNDMQQHAVSYRDRPMPVKNIEHTSNPKSWFFDPSIILDRDITTPDGKQIAVKGTRINPLNHILLTKTLVFYDADDKQQMQWVYDLDKKLKGQDKLILVKGSLLQEEKRLSKQIYFDQEGRLVKRFGITHVPALILQEGSRLKIMEVTP